MELLEIQTRGYERADVHRGIQRRMQFLEPADRKLLEITLSGKLTRREAGMIMGLDAGTVTRRIHTLLKRLNTRMVAALVEDGELLPEYHREVGLAFFLHRRSIRAISRHFGLSEYAVRRMIEYVRGWHVRRGNFAQRK
jgi:DNA-directed RNA polymerase specialized sigma24 family protein